MMVPTAGRSPNPVYIDGASVTGSPGTGGFDANYAWNVDKSGNIPLFSDHGTSYGSPATIPIPVSLIWVTSSGNTDSFGGLSYSYGSNALRPSILKPIAYFM